MMVSVLAFSRIVAGTLFTVGGVCLTLVALVGTPSFWYIPCICALIPLGFVWWFCKPSVAAALSLGPLVATTALLRFVSGTWFAIFATCLAVAFSIVLLALLNGSGWRTPLIISLAYVAAAFGTDRVFMSKVKIATFQMKALLNGRAPWGQVAPDWNDGTPPLVIYRDQSGSFCYTVLRSQELLDRIAQKHTDTVAVEYNVFSDFGHTRSFNVRSVDGVLLADGQRVFKDAERFSGEMLMDNFSSPCCP
jgi:hypothetical protein